MLDTSASDALTPGRRERERLARREAMLEAARALFAEKGYEQARLEEIAERAEFGKGTLYNYFEGGKQELLFAIFENAFEGVRRLIETCVADEAAAGHSVRTALRNLLACLIGHFSEERATFLILMKEAQRMGLAADGEAVQRLIALRERPIAALAVPIAAAMKAGALLRFDPHVVAHMLMGNVHGYLMYACSPAFSPEQSVMATPERAADFIAEILFDGLVTAPDAPFVLPAPSPS
jgi:TetR/AcrR family transcriptional regulator, repressor of fatR-cypB operon